MQSVSVIIIAKNEERRIEQALASITWANEIIVVDGESSDQTVEIAKKFTDKVYSRKFDDFSSQKNFAVSKCNYEWIFSLDCDEVVSQGLKQSIMAAINKPGGYAAFKVSRINKLFGKVLRYAAGNDFPIRLFQKDRACFEQPIHEVLNVNGSIGLIKGELFHNATADIKAEFDKTNRYTELEAQWLLERNIRPSLFRLIVYPPLIFLDIYLRRLGFLDAWAGFLYAFVSARYTFIKYRKARKLMKNPQYLENIISRRFDKIFSQFPEKIEENDNRLNSLITALGELSGKQVLEIGCGKGRFTNVVNKKNASCTGIDVSINFIREATRKNKGKFFLGSATNLAFKPSSFDAVFAVEVIEHITDLEKCFLEVKRVLKPDGIFVIIDRNILSINNRRMFVPNIIIKKYHELKNDWMYPRGFPYTEKWFFRKQIEKILEKYFDEVHSQYIISDSEQKSKISFLFNSMPVSRHFILWKASLAKSES